MLTVFLICTHSYIACRVHFLWKKWTALMFHMNRFQTISTLLLKCFHNLDLLVIGFSVIQFCLKSHSRLTNQSAILQSFNFANLESTNLESTWFSYPCKLRFGEFFFMNKDLTLTKNKVRPYSSLMFTLNYHRIQPTAVIGKQPCWVIPNLSLTHPPFPFFQ